MKFESALESQLSARYSKLLVIGAAEGAGAHVVVSLSAVKCQSQKVSKVAPWQSFLHLEGNALKTGCCWLDRLCLN